MVVHIPNIPEIVVISFDDELMDDLEEDPEDDPEFEEHEIDHEVDKAESSAFDNNFDLGEEPEDGSDPNYNLFRDH